MPRNVLGIEDCSVVNMQAHKLCKLLSHANHHVRNYTVLAFKVVGNLPEIVNCRWETSLPYIQTPATLMNIWSLTGLVSSSARALLEVGKRGGGGGRGSGPLIDA